MYPGHNRHAKHVCPGQVPRDRLVAGKEKWMNQQYKAFLLKYAEIGIKGRNRFLFENALRDQVKFALRSVDGDFRVTKEQGRIYIEAFSEFDYDDVISALQHVFGVAEICPVKVVESTLWEDLTKAVCDYIESTYKDQELTFKVWAKRADKNYERTSPQICADMGGVILDHFPNMTVDIHNPQMELRVEVRSKGYIYSERIKGPGGMPVGTAGSGMLLLSGGIDSPVAGYMIAKRGVTVEAVYFHAPPYTSDRAKQKVIDLARLVSKYSGPMKLHIVNFTDIQLYIYDVCPHDELTIIMRRYMMKIAEYFAKKDGCHGLITGESIGQVASQTMQSLMATDEVCTLPVYRPVIGFDKQEIVDVSLKIDTYETSVLPYEDCCTTFVAKHPVTKPTLKAIHKSEECLAEKIDELFQQAIDTVEIMVIE